jgi:hypothetical protein
MSDLFDAGSLDSDKVGHLAYIVNSPSWMDFFEPTLREMMAATTALLIDPSVERKNNRSDDFLRGQIVVIRNFLEIPHFIIADAREREDTARKAAAEKDSYAERAANGTMAPMGFAPIDEGEY